MKFSTLNNITGWLIFLIATVVYAVTAEPTSSYWDCGEFISCSYKLMIPHPPGAPFFLLVGRFFSMFTSDPTKVAYMVNLVSVVSSAFTSLFLFWSITMLAKKIVNYTTTPTFGQSLTILGAGIVGSLAYTFTDSAWFNAVEAEVYAMSSFFTAFVFWAILKWEAKADEEGSDKWLILIAYMMGLSIGVHLLNLLATFAIGFVVYFRKYKPTAQGIIITVAISGAILLLMLIGIISGFTTIASWFELLFVNNFKLPFNSGSLFFVIILVAGIAYGIFYSIKHQKRILNTALLCLAFVIIGFSSYAIILIRTGYDPTIDMNDPGDNFKFLSYLNREQYGDRPLFKGPYFTAPVIKVEEGGSKYRKAEDKYVVFNYDKSYKYSDKHITFFPRAYSTQGHHIRAYRQWMNLPKGKPTFGDNLEFLFKYQINHMYVRYFMWNFAGRKSDIQDAGWMGPSDWGKKELPHIIETNKARNNYFMLPFLVGIIGLIYHFMRKEKDAWIVLLLFFFTGLAIILYLNQPPVEPRERDYTFTGSFWAFSIWIGLAVLAVADVLKKVVGSDAVRGLVATLVLLAVPGILVAENWDDHDRSNRFFSVDSAKNLLNSCAPNAILFTGGDNDTYPLWYAQEVEGFRTDVRVCNLSLLNTDWYISQMKRKSYESEPLPIKIPLEQYLEGTNDYIVMDTSQKQYMNLPEYLKLVQQMDPSINRGSGKPGDKYLLMQSNKLFLNIDKNKVMNQKHIPEFMKPYVTDRMEWVVSNSEYMDKKSLIILDLIVNCNWERPIYFATSVSQSDMMNLRPYLQTEGMAYRLVPARHPFYNEGWVNTDIMFENMTKNSFWRNLDNPKIYYNEWYYQFTSSERIQFYLLAESLIREGKNDKAKEALLYSLKVMPDASIPYDQTVVHYISPLFRVGEKQKAMELVTTIGSRLEANMNYAASEPLDLGELARNIFVAKEIAEALRAEGLTKEAMPYATMAQTYEDKYYELAR